MTIKLSFDTLERFLHTVFDVQPVDAGGRRMDHSSQGAHIDPMRCVNTSSAPRQLTDSTIATHVGVGRHTVFRWRKAGSIPLHSADRAAIHAGFHPIEIWGTEFYDGIDELV